jgi:tRNA dimethylallyltransferase
LAFELKPARIVAIVGPTASGKSALALEVAKRYGGEIVSCDSVQVYRGLDVGSGKPTIDERRLVPHHLIDILDLTQEMNAAIFAQLASSAIADIGGRGGLPLVTGGTGLYLTALLRGLFEQGGEAPDTRARLGVMAVRHGALRLHRLLSVRDPEYAAKTQPTDRIRIVRALEVCFTLGRPFSLVQRERKPAFAGETLMVGLNPGREELRGRVVDRVRRMLGNGLIQETERALAGLPTGLPRPRPLGAIGYREVAARLGVGPLPPAGDEELQRAIVISTMQYAKRQMTYFRRQFEVEWFAEEGAALARIGEWVGERN